jgi:hypothetical protein
LIRYFERLKERESYKSELLDYEDDSIKNGKYKLNKALQKNKSIIEYYGYIKSL